MVGGRWALGACGRPPGAPGAGSSRFRPPFLRGCHFCTGHPPCCHRAAPFIEPSPRCPPRRISHPPKLPVLPAGLFCDLRDAGGAKAGIAAADEHGAWGPAEAAVGAAVPGDEHVRWGVCSGGVSPGCSVTSQRPHVLSVLTQEEGTGTAGWQARGLLGDGGRWAAWTRTRSPHLPFRHAGASVRYAP